MARSSVGGSQCGDGGNRASRHLADTSDNCVDEFPNLLESLLQAGLSHVVTRILLLLDPPSMHRAKQVMCSRVKRSIRSNMGRKE